MSLQEIEIAIKKLTSEERARLSAILAEQESREWDERLEKDLDSGRFDNLITELTNEYKQGLTKPL
jgi:hypothetical protein